MYVHNYPTSITLDHDNNRLCIATSFTNKDKCKALPGARWSPAIKQWTVPATASAAQAIAQFFPPTAAHWYADALTLLSEAETIVQAAAHKDADDLPFPAITNLDEPPWQHQIRGYHFAKNLTACMLAMKMRTGKTRLTIDLLQNRGSKLILVVCPNKVIEGEVWTRQVQRYCMLKSTVLELAGDSVPMRQRQLVQAVDLNRVRGEMLFVCLNYEAVWREPLASTILTLSWDSVILDESHRIKKPGGKASLFFSRLGDKAPHRLTLTGTPMADKPLDVYGQYRFLDKGIFGTSFVNFRARYAVMGGFGAKQVIGYQNQEELHRKFYSIAYRVLTEDVLDLPEKQDIFSYCTLSAYAMQLYKELEAEFVTAVDNGTVTASNVLTRILRFQQLSSGYLKKDRDIETGEEGEVIRVDHSKQELLASLLEELADDEPVVVYCRFHHDLDAVHEVASVLGRTSSEVSGRKSEMRAWQNGETTILAVQIQSGSEGNDFSRAHYMFFYSVGHSLSNFEQAYMRIRSSGQKHSCSYYYLVAKGTKDAAIYQALRDKDNIVEAIMRREA